MKTNLLIGVDHNVEEGSRELVRVRRKIKWYKWPYNKTVGLESPEKYNARINTPFFGELERYLLGKGIEVYSLDDLELYRECLAISTAKGRNEEEIRADLVELNTQIQDSEKDPRYLPPEYRSELARTLTNFLSIRKILERALQIIESNPTEQEVDGLFMTINRAREEHMLRRIRYFMPTVLVIGNHHAKNMEADLPAYDYIKSEDL